MEDKKSKERERMRLHRERRSPEQRAKDNEKKAAYRQSKGGRDSNIKTCRAWRERKQAQREALAESQVIRKNLQQVITM